MFAGTLVGSYWANGSRGAFLLIGFEILRTPALLSSFILLQVRHAERGRARCSSWAQLAWRVIGLAEAWGCAGVVMSMARLRTHTDIQIHHHTDTDRLVQTILLASCRVR